MNRIRRCSILKSAEDASVNFVFEGDFPGKFEARFVHRRDKPYFTCYLSTQSGCRQGCAFCHLTTTGQTEDEDATREELIHQGTAVLTHFQAERSAGAIPDVDAVHFSCMARGEPLASARLLAEGDSAFNNLALAANSTGLLPRFMVSTIIPKRFTGNLARIFPTTQPIPYYSIYSTSAEFRRRWLPAARPVPEALAILREYQDQTGRIVRLHWALIEGENDSIADARRIIDAVNEAKLRVDVNLVRYNPHSPEQGREPDDATYRLIESNLRAGFPLSKVKVVDRVGRDVYASCGVFAPASS